jgi:hypothetical protein
MMKSCRRAHSPILGGNASLFSNAWKILTALLLAASSALAETVITLNTRFDVVNAGDGYTSLREAVDTANAGSDNYRIQMSPTAGSLFKYELTGYGDNNNATGDIDINMGSRRLAICVEFGGGDNIAEITAANADRIFHVRSGTVVFGHLRLVQGRATDDGNGSANGRGGGILIENGGHVTLSNVSIQTCSAESGLTCGGGLFVSGGGTLTVEGGDLTGNHAEGGTGAAGTSSSVDGGTGYAAFGGALYVDTSVAVTINRCTVSNNWVRGGTGGTGAEGRGGSGFYDPSPGGVGGTGGAGAGGFAYVALGGLLNGNNVTVSGNACYGGTGGAGGPGGWSAGNTWQAAGGNGGTGGDAADSPRGIYVSSGTVLLGGYGANTYAVGSGGSSGAGSPPGDTGSNGSYVPCGLMCIDVSVHRSIDEAGTRVEFIGDVRVDLLQTNGTLLCYDVSRSSSTLDRNSGMCHTLPAPLMVRAGAPPYGYRRGASPPSSFSREEGVTGLSTAFTGSAVFTYPIYNGPIYVSPTGGNRYPYCDWASAAQTIAGGEAAAWMTTGSVVLLSVGTHVLDQNLNLCEEETVRGDGDDPSRVIVRQTGDACVFSLIHPAARLEGVTVTGGHSPWGGGGVQLDGGRVDRCIITGNSGEQYGGGVLVYGTGTVRNCLVVSNACSQRGGGVALTGAGTIESCTLYGNSAGISGGGLYVNAGATIRNDIVWSNTAPVDVDWSVSGGASADYCCTRPLLGVHSVTGDPVFVNAQAGDFRLRAASSCVDKGLMLGWMMSSATDLRAAARVAGSEPDIGAYELRYFAITSSVPNGHGTIAPSGVVICPEFEDAAFSMIPTNGSEIRDVLVDGVSVGAASGYTFENVTSNHSISVIFRNFIYVSHSGTAVWPYTDWTTAARTLAQATSAVTQASLILVTNGTYALTNAMVLVDDVTLRGVSGASNTTVVIQGPDNGLVLGGGVVDGFTITGGGSNDPAVMMIGGTLQSCVLTGNQERAVLMGYASLMRGCRVADNWGGVHLAEGRVEDCVVAGNTTFGIRADYATSTDSIVIANSRIVSNSGCGVSFDSYGVLRNCLIAGNTSTSSNYAGGVNGAATYIENCVIVSNTGPVVGGLKAQLCPVVNTTIADNFGEACGGVFCAGGELINSIVYGNRNTGMTTQRNVSVAVNIPGCSTTVVANCCTTPMLGTNSVGTAPGFANTAASDYRLTVGSPCIDAGRAAGAPSTDFLGTARPLDGDSNGVAAADIGAYEYVCAGVDTDHDGIPDTWEVAKRLCPTNAADAPVDSDDDGDINTSEYIADTDPYDGDPFHIRDVRRTNTCAVGFIGSTGRVYTLYACTNIDQDAWQLVSGCVSQWGIGTNTALIDTNASLHRTYRISVALP